MTRDAEDLWLTDRVEPPRIFDQGPFGCAAAVPARAPERERREREVRWLRDVLRDVRAGKGKRR